ncbi:MAG: DUF202 domain-containing protein [Nodosilinea sp.]
MSETRPQKLFDTTNELAKERNRGAAERTINSWIGHCINLIGFGFALEQISRRLRLRFPAGNPLFSEAATHLTSILFIILGLGLLGLALMQHRLAIAALEQEAYVLLSINTLNRIVVAAILLTASLGLVATLFLN